jgi:hypothetical protein
MKSVKLKNFDFKKSLLPYFLFLGLFALLERDESTSNPDAIELGSSPK